MQTENTRISLRAQTGQSIRCLNMRKASYRCHDAAQLNRWARRLVDLEHKASS